MNKYDVIELAREALSEEPYAEVVVPFGETVWMMNSLQLERFAALVADYVTFEFTALHKEVKKLREENFRMREVLMASYAPRAFQEEDNTNVG